MRRTTFSLGGAALRILILALCVPLAAGAAELSPRALKKSLKQAEKAWSAGRIETAVELYEGVLDATEPGAPERAGALYAVGLASLGGGEERAGELLAELVEKFPRHPSSTAAKAIVSLLSDLKKTRAESVRLAAELRSQEAELRKAAAQSDREASESQAVELAELREKLVRAEAELAASQDARDQLAKKDKEIADCEEKLRKVRETLVGGGGSS